jgi:hypothetical protein
VAGQRRLDVVALLGPVLSILRQVQHASHAAGGERIDVLSIQRIRADDQLGKDLGEAIAFKPVRHSDEEE